MARTDLVARIPIIDGTVTNAQGDSAPVSAIVNYGTLPEQEQDTVMYFLGGLNADDTHEPWPLAIEDGYTADFDTEHERDTNTLVVVITLRY